MSTDLPGYFDSPGTHAGNPLDTIIARLRLPPHMSLHTSLFRGFDRGYSLRLEHMVYDATDEDRSARIKVEMANTIEAEHAKDVDFVLGIIDDMVRGAFAHEASEWLVFDGKHLHDPHPKPKVTPTTATGDL